MFPFLAFCFPWVQIDVDFTVGQGQLTVNLSQSNSHTMLLTGEVNSRNLICVLLIWYKHNQQLMKNHLTENYLEDLQNKHRYYTKHLRSVNRHENWSSLAYVEILVLPFELNSNNLRIIGFRLFYFIVFWSGKVVTIFLSYKEWNGKKHLLLSYNCRLLMQWDKWRKWCSNNKLSACMVG